MLLNKSLSPTVFVTWLFHPLLQTMDKYIYPLWYQQTFCDTTVKFLAVLKIEFIFFNTFFLFFSPSNISFPLSLSPSLYNCPVPSQHTQSQFSAFFRISIQQWAAEVDRLQRNHWKHKHNKLTCNVDISISTSDAGYLRPDTNMQEIWCLSVPVNNWLQTSSLSESLQLNK